MSKFEGAPGSGPTLKQRGGAAASRCCLHLYAQPKRTRDVSLNITINQASHGGSHTQLPPPLATFTFFKVTLASLPVNEAAVGRIQMQKCDAL